MGLLKKAWFRCENTCLSLTGWFRDLTFQLQHRDPVKHCSLTILHFQIYKDLSWEWWTHTLISTKESPVGEHKIKEIQESELIKVWCSKIIHYFFFLSRWTNHHFRPKQGGNEEVYAVTPLKQFVWCMLHHAHFLFFPFYSMSRCVFLCLILQQFACDYNSNSIFV